MRSLSALLAVSLASAASAKLAAVMTADWGGQTDAPYTKPGQVACAAGMAKVAEEIGANFALALGDNFYEYGLYHEARFNETFENVYTGKALDIPWYLTLGNHDYLGHVQAQIDYTNKSSRWNLPSHYYSKSYDVGRGADGRMYTMDIIYIDTVVLAGNSDLQEDPYAPLEGPADPLLAQTQWDWIEEHLKNSKADYLFTAGHYPVWSGCQHGPTPQLVTNLRPMLEKYNATGHLAGHDHCLEHIDEGRGPMYVVVGAGDECCYHNKKVHLLPKGALQFAVWNDGNGNPMEGGFGSMVATPDELTISYHAANGTLLYVTPPVFPRQLQ